MSGLAAGHDGAAGLRLSTAARWVLVSTLITNIGNGMHTLTVGKLLYDQTGSASAFGIVIIVDYIITFVLQLLAGSVVDRGTPKATCVWTDTLRGLFICFASFMLASAYMNWWVLAATIVINIAKPFYRSAIFALGPAVAPPELLTRYNGYTNSFLQVGQLLGVALAAPIIQYWGTNVAFGLNGVSFLLAALAVSFAPVTQIERKIDQVKRSLLSKMQGDWGEMLRLLRADRALSWHVLLATGDYLAISLLNLSLVPLVNTWYGGNTFWLSAFDGAFAVGALSSSVLAARVVSRCGARNLAFMGIGGQAICFALIGLTQQPLLTIGLMLALGALNTLSVVVFSSNLQRRSTGPIKGRIAAIRNLGTAIVAGVVIPLVIAAQEVSLTRGLLTCGLACAMFSITAFYLSRERVFGAALLGTAPEVEAI